MPIRAWLPPWKKQIARAVPGRHTRAGVAPGRIAVARDPNDPITAARGPNGRIVAPHGPNARNARKIGTRDRTGLQSPIPGPSARKTARPNPINRPVSPAPNARPSNSRPLRLKMRAAEMM